MLELRVPRHMATALLELQPAQKGKKKDAKNLSSMWENRPQWVQDPAALSEQGGSVTPFATRDATPVSSTQSSHKMDVGSVRARHQSHHGEKGLAETPTCRYRNRVGGDFLPWSLPMGKCARMRASAD